MSNKKCTIIQVCQFFSSLLDKSGQTVSGIIQRHPTSSNVIQRPSSKPSLSDWRGTVLEMKWSLLYFSHNSDLFYMYIKFSLVQIRLSPSFSPLIIRVGFVIKFTIRYVSHCRVHVTLRILI